MIVEIVFKSGGFRRCETTFTMDEVASKIVKAGKVRAQQTFFFVNKTAIVCINDISAIYEINSSQG